MQITIAAVGRLKSGAEAELVRTYIKRAAQAGRSTGIRCVAVSEVQESVRRSARERKREEAAALMNAAQQGAMLIAFDERGDDLSSRQLSAIVGNAQEAGTSQLVFMVGGPDGLDETVRAAAARTVRLGRLTWPHRLARVMIAEQIYRAVTILVNHPYHRD